MILLMCGACKMLWFHLMHMRPNSEFFPLGFLEKKALKIIMEKKNPENKNNFQVRICLEMDWQPINNNWSVINIK